MYSLGVGEVLSFSQQTLQTYSNAQVYAFDPTPKAAAYASKHPISQDPRFHFIQCGISNQNGDTMFHLPKNENYVSGSILFYDGVREDGIVAQMKTLSKIMTEQYFFSQLCMKQRHRFFLKESA